LAALVANSALLFYSSTKETRFHIFVLGKLCQASVRHKLSIIDSAPFRTHEPTIADCHASESGSRPGTLPIERVRGISAISLLRVLA
jgi:hypothetical protein